MEMTDKTTGVAGPDDSQVPSWKISILCVLVIAAASVYFFRGVFNPANTIEGMDSSLWAPMLVHTWSKGLLVPRWISHFFAGVPQQVFFLSHGLPFALLISPERYHGFQFLLDSFLAGAFMFAFLRDRKLGRFGALVGGLAFQLGNNLLSEASLGGMWKFATACWVPLFLLFFLRVIEGTPNRLRNSVFAGAALGLQLLGGEVQLTYYVGLLAGAYFLFHSTGRLLESHGVEPLIKRLQGEGRRALWGALCTAFAIVFAAEVFCNYGSFTQVSESVGVRSEEDNWKFVTEFSFPPKETIALALTGGAFGSDDYPLEHMGRPIKRISDDYLGIVVLAFAFMALFSGNRKAWFFAGAALVALIISYGRFFPPLFKLVYALPVMKGLRNPHKWVFITALCVPILAGMGADYWRKAPPSKNLRILCAIISFFLFMVACAYLSPAITGNLSGTVSSSVYGRIAVLVAACFLCLLGRSKVAGKSRIMHKAIPLLIIALLAGDLIHNASRFIKYYDYRERYVDDELVKWMTAKPEPFRVKLWSADAYLRYLMTEVLPYHGIGTPDVIASRRPARYSHIFEALRDGRLPLEKFLQLFNVKYIVSSNVVGGTGVPMKLETTFRRGSAGSPSGGTYVYEMDSFLPRVYVVGEFELAATEDVIDNIGRSDFDLHRTVVFEEPPDFAAGEGIPEWNMRDFSYSPQRISVRIESDRPGILVLQDYYDPGWRAHIDGKETDILRTNYLMRGVELPRGDHEVLFTHNPPLWGFFVTLASLAATLSLAAFTVASSLRHKRGNGVQPG